MGPVNVVATDVRNSGGISARGPFAYCDVTDRDSLSRLVVEHRITHVLHLASLLSAVGERNPQLALRVNMLGIQNVLEVAAQHRVSVCLSLSPPRHVPPCCMIVIHSGADCSCSSHARCHSHHTGWQVHCRLRLHDWEMSVEHSNLPQTPDHPHHRQSGGRPHCIR